VWRGVIRICGSGLKTRRLTSRSKRNFPLANCLCIRSNWVWRLILAKSRSPQRPEQEISRHRTTETWYGPLKNGPRMACRGVSQILITSEDKGPNGRLRVPAWLRAQPPSSAILPLQHLAPRSVARERPLLEEAWPLLPTAFFHRPHDPGSIPVLFFGYPLACSPESPRGCGSLSWPGPPRCTPPQSNSVLRGTGQCWPDGNEGAIGGVDG